MPTPSALGFHTQISIASLHILIKRQKLCFYKTFKISIVVNTG